MSDEQQVEQGKVVKFGLGQLNNDTPLFIKYIMRGFAFLSGIWAILPQDLAALTDHQYGQANRWILFTNAVLLFAIKFFGWDTPKDQ